jgi:hypothetical protein
MERASITVKTAAGSLVTVRAESGEELDQVVSTALDALVSATTELESAIRGAATQSAPMQTNQIAAALGASIIETGNTYSAQEYGTPSLGKSCPHGKMTAIQGTGKDGKMYRGYFCPAPKGAFDKCKNQYVRAGSAEWNTFIADQVK